MNVQILHVPDCPNVELLRDRLQLAMETSGLDANIRVTEVTTAEGAHRLGLHGSPTLLIDGDDPLTGPEAEPSMSCRLFDTSGTLDRAPSVEQLVAALRSTPQGRSS